MIVKRKSKLIVALDWIVATAALVAGACFVVIEWPNPSLWSWLFLAVGVVGVPLAAFNPVGRINTWVLRRLVKPR